MTDRCAASDSGQRAESPGAVASPSARAITLDVQDPRRGTVRLEAGGHPTLMALLRDRGLSVMALCGGGMSCGTCHVHLPSPWAERVPAASADEVAILEGCEDYRPGVSRLSCQLHLQPALDGARLTVIGE